MFMNICLIVISFIAVCLSIFVIISRVQLNKNAALAKRFKSVLDDLLDEAMNGRVIKTYAYDSDPIEVKDWFSSHERRLETLQQWVGIGRLFELVRRYNSGKLEACSFNTGTYNRTAESWMRFAKAVLSSIELSGLSVEDAIKLLNIPAEQIVGELQELQSTQNAAVVNEINNLFSEKKTV